MITADLMNAALCFIRSSCKLAISVQLLDVCLSPGGDKEEASVLKKSRCWALNEHLAKSLRLGGDEGEEEKQA
ncbi:hypothetical protein XENOCAPTIV_016216 [Xenoophorus captivus]|uniref:Uncharacterized protein n=1 Tax=Xenoophorus captivus TaxID=1517983 RepID=A0ABV0RHX3_9TELE